MKYSKETIYDALRHVTHPELNKDIVELEMVQNIVIEENKISFNLVDKKGNDPLISSIRKACVNAILKYVDENAEIKGNINIVAPEKKEEERKVLPQVKNIIAVASGKGGVGKSTIATNLAVHFAKLGYKTGIIDADIFGPSIPKMFNVENAQPAVHKINDVEMIIPVEQYGVKVLSIGFFVDQENALIWRGPMATNALRQFIHQTDWGALDFLFIDLPPGTSDIHLTLVQEVPVTGVVVVSTPQKVALADAIKGISMFNSDKINVPILGLIENMAWFTPEEFPDNKYFIFGKEGVKKLASDYKLPLLGQIPIVQSICDNGDQGTPSVIEESSLTSRAFKELSENLLVELNKRNQNFDPTKIVEITNTDGCAASKN
jgi:ATP-binding protein involved in chromosome partitioning